MQASAKRLGRESLVIRILWMLLFLLAWQIAAPLLAVMVLLQLVYRLVQGQPHLGLMQWGDSLSQYLMQIGRFSAFQTEEKPWPVADWPAPETPKAIKVSPAAEVTAPKE